MMQRRRIRVVYLIVIMIVSVSRVTLVEAAEGNPLGFSVEAILPDSQIDKDQGYFYLKTEPGKAQEVKVKVTGTSDEPVKVKVYTANASTSEQGTIEYKSNSKKDETLKESIQEITKVDTPEFEIKKNEERIVTIKVNVPTESYSGIKLGTIYFEKIDESKTKSNAVKSTYAYRIGMMLSENDGSYTDGKELNLLAVKPELKRLQKMILLTLQNPEPKIIESFSMKTSIVEEKSGKVVKKQELKDGRLAPNSQFDFGVSWGIDPIPAGDYIAKVDAKSDNENWSLEKKFSISEEQAKKMNEETVYKLTLPTWAYLVTCLIGVLIVVDGTYLTFRYKKFKKQSSSKKKKQKKNRKS